MNMLLRSYFHPEARNSEVFLRNCTKVQFQALPLTSKRFGTQPYDGENRPIVGTSDWFPVFIEVSEALALPISLHEYRRQMT